MEDPYFKPEPRGPILSDKAVKTICHAVLALAAIVGATVVGTVNPELAESIAGGVGLLLFMLLLFIL